MVNITHYDLKQLKDNCQRIVDAVKIIEHTDVKKLFASRDDYEASLEEKNLLPEKYYNIRLFNYFSEINYNSRFKKYQIKLQNFYSKVLDNYKNNQRNFETYIISDSFDETLDVFKDVILDLVSNIVPSNHLNMDIF